MKYLEFVQKIQLEAHTQLGIRRDGMKLYEAGFTSDDPEKLKQIRKCNRKYEGRDEVVLLNDTLLIEDKRQDGGTIVVRVLPQRLYKIYQESGFKAAFNEIASQVGQIREASIDFNRINLRSGSSYADIRANLIVRPLNVDLHRNDLRGFVYEKTGDVALVLYQLLGNADGMMTTSRIGEEELQKWAMDDKRAEVFRDALANTCLLFPPIVLDAVTMEEQYFLEGDLTKERITYGGCIILSAKHTPNGAAAVFYPGVKEKMYRLLGEPFVIVFMNVCDAMILNRKSPMIRAALKTAGSFSEFGENLSRQCFICDGKSITPFKPLASMR